MIHPTITNSQMIQLIWDSMGLVAQEIAWKSNSKAQDKMDLRADEVIKHLREFYKPSSSGDTFNERLDTISNLPMQGDTDFVAWFSVVFTAMRTFSQSAGKVSGQEMALEALAMSILRSRSHPDLRIQVESELRTLQKERNGDQAIKSGDVFKLFALVKNFLPAWKAGHNSTASPHPKRKHQALLSGSSSSSPGSSSSFTRSAQDKSGIPCRFGANCRFGAGKCAFKHEKAGPSGSRSEDGKRASQCRKCGHRHPGPCSQCYKCKDSQRGAHK